MTQLDRRTFLAGVVAAPLAAQAQASIDLEELTIAEMRRFSARALTEAYLARIDALDENGPAVNSVIELNPDALAIADSLDRERSAGRVRGPLHGIPILIK